MHQRWLMLSSLWDIHSHGIWYLVQKIWSQNSCFQWKWKFNPPLETYIRMKYYILYKTYEVKIPAPSFFLGQTLGWNIIQGQVMFSEKIKSTYPSHPYPLPKMGRPPCCILCYHIAHAHTMKLVLPMCLTILQNQGLWNDELTLQNFIVFRLWMSTLISVSISALKHPHVQCMHNSPLNCTAVALAVFLYFFFILGVGQSENNYLPADTFTLFSCPQPAQ